MVEVICNTCNLEFSSGESFCPSCGQKLVAKPAPMPATDLSSDLSEPINKEEVSLYKEGEKKKPPLKKILIGALCVALVAIAIPVLQDRSESRKIAEEMRVKELEAQSLSDAFGIDLLQANYPDCTLIQNIISASSFPELEAQAAESKKITDARDALSFVSSNSITASGLKEKYENDLNVVLSKNLDDMFINSDRDEDAPEYQKSTWKNQWEELTLASCGLADQNTTIRTMLTKLDSEFRRLTRLADSVPWYPEDFYEFDSNIAYKYNNDRCDYFACSTVTLISKASCSNLYAEMTLSDSSGANVGFTNDSASSVQPFQEVKLRFDVTEDRAETGRLVEVNCY